MQNVLEVPLFFGLALDASLMDQIAHANVHQENLFFHDETGNYLQELVVEKTHYLGKWIGHTVTSQDLALFETHIYSILSKVMGPIDHSKHPLKLIAVPQIPQIYAASGK